MALTFRLYKYKLDYSGATPVPVLQNIVVPEVLTLGDIEETLELEDGGFRLGNVSPTVRGLPESYFRTTVGSSGAGDINAPFVFEIADGNTAIWHGPVQASSIDYDQGKGLTSFTARSWDAVLADAPAMPARSVYEANVASVGTADVIIPFKPNLAIGFFGGVKVYAGDTIVLDGPVGEVRETVVRSYNDPSGFYATAEILPPAPVTIFQNQFRTGRHNNGNSAEVNLPADITDAVRAALPENGTQDDQPAWYSQSGQTAEITFLRENGTIVKVARVRYITYRSSGNNVLARVRTVDGALTEAEWNQTTKTTLRTSASVRPGTSARILGQDLYGFVAPGGVGGNRIGIAGVIEAMLFVGENNSTTQGEGRPLGALPNVVRTVSWEGFVGSLPTLPRGVELPDRPIEALRLLQNTGGFFARFVPAFTTANGQRVPCVDVKLLSRASVENGALIQAPARVIRSWTEKAVAEQVRAVVVRANEDYRKPKTEAEFAGVWFTDEAGRTPDQIAAITTDTNANGVPDGRDRLRYLAVPTGDGVVEVEMAVEPAWRGAYSFGGGSQPTFNDNVLKERARTLWSYYANGGRRVSARLALGYAGADLVGKRVSFDEAGLQATVFVTKRTVSLRDGALDTQIEGLIGAVYTPGTPQPPVAIISGSLAVSDGNSDGSALVELSAGRSYSPTGDGLTYAWRRRALGEVAFGAVLSTDLFLSNTVVATPGVALVYEYELTVTSAAGSVSDIEAVVVSETQALVTVPDPRTYNDIQFVVGNNGFAKLYLARPDAISSVYFRRVVGQELPQINWATSSDPAAFYPHVKLARSGFDATGDFWEYDVALSTAHLSYIEAYVKFNPELNVEPLIIRWSFDADTLARLRDVTVYQNADRGVFLSVSADEDTARLVYTVNQDPPVTVAGNTIVGTQIRSDADLGDQIVVTVTPYSLEALVYTAGEPWTRTYTVAQNSASEPTSNGPFFIFTPGERNSPTVPGLTGTVFFDQDGGDGLGNRAGLQVKHINGFATVWDQTNHGAGSGLDADLLDGIDSLAFTQKAANTTVTGLWNFTQVLTAATLAVNGSATVDNALIVTGQATLGSVMVTANAVVGGTIGTVGLNVTGAGTFTNPVTLLAPGTTTAHAVRADRAISVGPSLFGGGNLTANVLLDTVQDIRTTANPTFATVSLLAPAGTDAYLSIDCGTTRNSLIVFKQASAIKWALFNASSNHLVISRYPNGEYRQTASWDFTTGLFINGYEALFIGAVTTQSQINAQAPIFTSSAGVVLGTVGFESGFTGFGLRIGRRVVGAQSRYGIEADEMTIRGTFSVYEILAREISAVNGNLYISAQNEVLSVTGGGSTVSTAAPSGSFTFTYTGLSASVAYTGSSVYPITSYAWTWGDGSTSVGASPLHTYGANGAYTVQLVVTDSAGGTSTSRVTVTLGSNAPTPLLDTVPTAAYAFALTQLRTAYVGPLVRVYRMSDGVEADISASGGTLDTAALLAFCGASEGRVRTWYDQSGQARHATQGNSGFMPRICAGGAVEMRGGAPCMVFTGSFFNIPEVSFNAGSFAGAYALDPTDAQGMLFSASDFNAQVRHQAGNILSLGYAPDSLDTGSPVISQAYGTAIVSQWHWTGADVSFRVGGNGTSADLAGGAKGGPIPFNTIGRLSGGPALKAQFHSLVAWPAVKTSDAVAIGTALGAGGGINVGASGGGGGSTSVGSTFFASTTGSAASPNGVVVVTVKDKVKLTTGSFVIGQILALDYTSSTRFRGRVTATTTTTITLDILEGACVAGMTLARYDHATQIDQRGSIYIATSESESPYLTVNVGDGFGNWATQSGKLRLGKLDGFGSVFTGLRANTFGLAAGNTGEGWASFTDDGVEFWNGDQSVGYVKSDGIKIGAGTSYLRFNPIGQVFQLVINGSAVITASTGDIRYATSAQLQTQAQILTANGLLLTSNITQRVTNLGASTVLTASAGGVVSAISLEAGTAQSAIVIRADQIDYVGLSRFSSANSLSAGMSNDDWTLLTADAVSTGTTPLGLSNASAFSVLDTGASGNVSGLVIRVNGAGLSLLSRRTVAIDTTKSYRLTVKLRRLSGTSTVRAGLALYDNNYNPTPTPTRRSDFETGPAQLPAGGAWLSLSAVYSGNTVTNTSFGTNSGSVTRFARLWVACGHEEAGVSEIEVAEMSLRELANLDGSGLGSLAQLNEVNFTNLGLTIIDGGYIRADKIQVNDLLAERVLARTIAVAATAGTVYLNPDGLTGALAIAIGPGNLPPLQMPFRVDYNGALVATSATITGTVYANAGYFRGTLQTNSADATGGNGLYVNADVFRLGSGGGEIKSGPNGLDITASRFSITVDSGGGFMGLNNTRLAFGTAVQNGFEGGGIFIGIAGYDPKVSFGDTFRYANGLLSVAGFNTAAGAFYSGASAVVPAGQTNGERYTAGNVIIASEGWISTPSFYVYGAEAGFKGKVNMLGGTIANVVVTGSLSIGAGVRIENTAGGGTIALGPANGDQLFLGSIDFGAATPTQRLSGADQQNLDATSANASSGYFSSPRAQSDYEQRSNTVTIGANVSVSVSVNASIVVYTSSNDASGSGYVTMHVDCLTSGDVLITRETRTILSGSSTLTVAAFNTPATTAKVRVVIETQASSSYDGASRGGSATALSRVSNVALFASTNLDFLSPAGLAFSDSSSNKLLLKRAGAEVHCKKVYLAENSYLYDYFGSLRYVTPTYPYPGTQITP